MENVFETKKVFSQELLGKAVNVTTMNGEKHGVITDVKEDEIEIAGVGGYRYFNIHQIGASARLEFLIKPSEVEKQDESEVVTIKPKHVRNNEQIENENMYLTTVLMNNGGEMHLSQIIERMVAAGYPHWATSNASAHIATAQRWGKPIARVRKGYFKYVGEVL